MLGASRPYPKIYFYEKIRHGISCESSAGQTIKMECQALFFFFRRIEMDKNIVCNNYEWGVRVNCFI